MPERQSDPPEETVPQAAPVSLMRGCDQGGGDRPSTRPRRKLGLHLGRQATMLSSPAVLRRPADTAGSNC